MPTHLFGGSPDSVVRRRGLAGSGSFLLARRTIWAALSTRSLSPVSLWEPRDIDPGNGVVHIAFSYVVKGGTKLRKDTKTHQDRHIAIHPVTCALIQETLDEVTAVLAEVGVTVPAGAYLFSNDPAHARPWNPDWVTRCVRDLARAAGIELFAVGTRITGRLGWTHPDIAGFLTGTGLFTIPDAEIAHSAAAGGLRAGSSGSRERLPVPRQPGPFVPYGPPGEAVTSAG
jgi:hypothetical protein